jgi:hypothetical protein
MTRLLAVLLAAGALHLAIQVPAQADDLAPPTVKLTGAKTKDGQTVWTFEVANTNRVAVPYVGYTSESFEGGLPEGTISPIFRVQLQQAGEWKPHSIGFCGTGIGPVTLPPKSKVTFEILPPPGDWTAAQVGLAWYDTADPEEKPSVAWSAPIKAQER